MPKFEEVKGNLITLAKEGEFDVIAHGCNCFCVMGAGIAPQMADAFGVNKYTLEGTIHRGDYSKLGNIQYGLHITYKDGTTENTSDAFVSGKDIERSLITVNAYTQYGMGVNHKEGTKVPLNYVALRMCMNKMNHEFKGLHVGLPLVGCGLAGGDWKRVKLIIQEELTDVDVTIVHYTE